MTVKFYIIFFKASFPNKSILNNFQMQVTLTNSRLDTNYRQMITLNK